MPPKKKVAALIKLQINAGAATPAPPIGPALGQHGVNIMEFCKAYNAATESQRGNVIPVEITVYEDRSFTFITKTPPAAELIKKAAGVAKGSPTPHTVKVAALTEDQVREIATAKLEDLNANDIEAAMKIVAGTARSMGITVQDGGSGLSTTEPFVTDRSGTVAGPGAGPLTTTATCRRRADDTAQQGVPRRRGADRPDAAVRAARGDPAGEEDVDHHVRRDDRGGVPRRRRPPQGGPDGPRHGEPAARHRQDRSGPGLRHR